MKEKNFKRKYLQKNSHLFKTVAASLSDAIKFSNNYKEVELQRTNTQSEWQFHVFHVHC